ncbi:hypothetical protein HMPREF3224_02450, partial [Anaerococcus hydrogenalis]
MEHAAFTRFVFDADAVVAGVAGALRPVARNSRNADDIAAAGICGGIAFCRQLDSPLRHDAIVRRRDGVVG